MTLRDGFCSTWHEGHMNNTPSKPSHEQLQDLCNRSEGVSWRQISQVCLDITKPQRSHGGSSATYLKKQTNKTPKTNNKKSSPDLKGLLGDKKHCSPGFLKLAQIFRLDIMGPLLSFSWATWICVYTLFLSLTIGKQGLQWRLRREGIKTLCRDGFFPGPLR